MRRKRPDPQAARPRETADRPTDPSEPGRTPSALKSVWMILRASFAAAPGATAATLVLHPIGYLEAPLVALGLRFATNGAVAGDPRLLGLAGVLLVTALCVFHIVNHTAWQLSLGLEDRVAMVLDRRIGELVSGTPGLAAFERPQLADRLEMLRERGWVLGRAMYLLPIELGEIARAAVTFVLLGTVHPALLLLPVFALPSILMDARSERRAREAEEGSVDAIRRSRHLYELATTAGPGRELRVFALGPEILSRHRKEWQRIHAARISALKESTGRSILGWICYACGFVAAAAFVGWRVWSGAASVGDLVLTLALAAQVNGEARVAVEIVGWVRWVASIGGHLLWLEQQRDRDAHARAGTEMPPGCLRDGIAFEHVSFRYPGTDRWVVRDVSLHLAAGATVAIVGENGAGKTTLVKLLCRFYEPTEGTITVDGRRLPELEREQWLKRVTASFQDFCRFELLLREAVGIGDLAPAEVDRIRSAVRRADATDVLAALPHDLETQLGSTWPSGVDLSTGQWQKVALARTMMRREPLLLVLDEPTASLDPQTEYSLFERQAQASRGAPGAITLIVSHRFSTVARADRIVVMREGAVVEQGTHAELMARPGLYAELYSLQARAYRRKT
ncbi:MAG TPA: ABC transporter ATP-binding protein [Spirochaetia bacterium]|nr:ABC transporter ATP-binding protein [Spirochaetia bacterium]